MLIWNPWLDAVKFSFEVQNVIASRLLKIATEGAASSAERTRMVTENIKAVADAQAANAVALAQDESLAQAADTLPPAQDESLAQAADAVAPAQGESINTATKRAIAPIKTPRTRQSSSAEGKVRRELASKPHGRSARVAGRQDE
jgi:hypothetical protein